MEPRDPHSAWYWVHALSDRWTGEELRPAAARDPSWLTLQLSTAAAEGDAYEFWRHRVYYNFSADRRADPALPFAASAQAVISPRGEFVHARSSDLSGARTAAHISRDDDTNLTVGFVLEGARDYTIGDWRHRAGRGSLYLYDAGSPASLSLSSHQVVYLSLKAAAVHRVLAGERLDHALLLRRLESSPLLPYLRMQLSMLVETERRPRPADAGTLLHIAIDLALLMFCPPPEPTGQAVSDLRRGLIAAAQHVIVRHLDDPRLDGHFIATRLGCSRSTLYRAFADHGLMVAGHIRAMRLIRARHLLEHSGFSEHIGDLILHCGLEDTVHFSRQFRQMFGIRPSEIKGIRRDPLAV